MNRPSLEKFAMDVKPGGVILYDSTIGECTIPDNIRGIAVPAVEIARNAGAEKAANTVMLGVLQELGVTKLPAEAFVEALADNFAGKQKLIDINTKVLEAGAQWLRDNL
jgi:2-oxoisovalerate ferredoxin oxidoreductase beta subunit